MTSFLFLVSLGQIFDSNHIIKKVISSVFNVLFPLCFSFICLINCCFSINEINAYHEKYD